MLSGLGGKSYLKSIINILLKGRMQGRNKKEEMCYSSLKNQIISVCYMRKRNEKFRTS